jgi:hypothetical protein
MAIKRLAPVSHAAHSNVRSSVQGPLGRSTSASSACRMSGTATTWFEISEHEVSSTIKTLSIRNPPAYGPIEIRNVSACRAIRVPVSQGTPEHNI